MLDWIPTETLPAIAFAALGIGVACACVAVGLAAEWSLDDELESDE